MSRGWERCRCFPAAGWVLLLLGLHTYVTIYGVAVLRLVLLSLLVCHCPQVWSSSKEVLSRRLGAQTGASLWQHAHGIDERPVAPPKARRSVGADVNWGVRFSNAQEADTFLKVSVFVREGGEVNKLSRNRITSKDQCKNARGRHPMCSLSQGKFLVACMNFISGRAAAVPYSSAACACLRRHLRRLPTISDGC